MAAIVNDRDVLLQAAGTRVELVTLPANVSYNGDVSGNVTGDVTGTVSGSLSNASGIFAGQLNSVIGSINAVTGSFVGDAGGTFGGTSLPGIRNTSISLTSTGGLSGAGGGQISNLDYGNVGGTKPPATATTNFFSRSGSNPTGGVDGDAHWNTSTSTMWFKTGGSWAVGGTVNANQITVGTLAAARIAANSITADKITVGTLSDIDPALGTITSGLISGNSSINLTGSATFNGTTTSGGQTASVTGNPFSGGGRTGVWGGASSSGFSGVTGRGTGSANGVTGQSTSSFASGVVAINNSGGPALNVSGPITITTQVVSNLTAGNATNAAFAGIAGSANSVSGSNVSGTVANATTASNANALGGVTSSGWCRGIVCDSGTASAAGNGFGLISTVAGVRTRAFSTNNIVIESFSDKRLKTDIKDETLGIDFIHELAKHSCKYRLKENPDKVMHGYIAQEIEHLKPTNDDSLVTTHSDGIKGVDYNSLISVLVYNLSVQAKRIDELELTLLKTGIR